MFKIVTPSLLVLGLLVGCAKEKSYDEVNKTAELNFASALQTKKTMLEMCTTEDPCVYLPSVANTPYAITASRPFWQGEQKLVVANIDHGKLQYLQIEKDKRFQDNINNLSPVLDIAISHLDYKCSEDDYGDCTNKEEVDSDKHWSKRRYVQLNEATVVETNSLPIEFGELFQSGCFSATGALAERLEVTKKSLNMTVKKTYKANANCMALNEMADLRYLTFTVDYTYSIVKLSSLVDPNYPIANYPVNDESKFGYFTTELKTKTVDNHDHYMGVRKTLMNRWSPNKSEVVYKLNSEFYTEDNKIILDATKQAIETVNASLEKANAKFKIKLEKGEDEKIGDLRENYIILVKDPQASGVIGYGPSVTNPTTGEIINARTVMYFGTIQKFVSRAYDELVDEVKESAAMSSANAEAANAGNSESVMRTSPEASIVSLSSQQFAAAKASVLTLDRAKLKADVKEAQKKFSRYFETQIDDNIMASMNVVDREKAMFSKLKKQMEGGESSFQDKIAKMAEETFYHASNMNFDGAVIESLSEDLKEEKELKYWEQLTEEQRKEIMKKLVPYVWVPTMVHEFGHNLGLRHNFNGSTDKQNYYTTEERTSLGMRKNVTYSSIMDYAPNTNNELFVMGKYDVAALRFAYAREVELTDGSFFKIPTVSVEQEDGTTRLEEETLTKYIEGENAKELKPYMYCSDEHVSNDPLCNRFDDGDTFVKVVQNHVNNYKENYEKVNFRKRRYSFESRNGDYGYFNRTFSQFLNIRQFFEIYDQMAFRGEYEGEEWKKNPRLVDIKKAADISFNFFMDIIEEPAYHCVEITVKDGQVAGLDIKPFTEMVKGTWLENVGITFDIKDGCYYLNSADSPDKIYGSFGKYFNNSVAFDYDKTQAMQGDSSQIDVRGIWMDKVMATYISTVRFTSPTNYGTSASGIYMDYPEYKGRMLKTLDGMLTNSMSKQVDVTLPNGFVLPIETTYGVEATNKVNKSYNWMVNAIFGLRDSRTNLKSVMFSFLKGNLLDEQEEGSIENGAALESYYFFDVDKVSTRINLDRFNYDEVAEFKNTAGVVNHRFGLYNYNIKGMELLKLKQNLELAEIIGKDNANVAALVLSDENITMEMVVASGQFTAEEISDIEDAMELGIDFLNGYLSGTINEQVLLSSFIALSK